MDILHISDLHVGSGFSNINDAWIGPAKILKNQKFDFIVVSGDLTRLAVRYEFNLIAEFFSKKLLQLLCIPDITRIITVPGNHDVDWSAKDNYLNPIVWSKNSQDDWYQAALKARDKTCSFNIRSEIEKDGLRLYQITDQNKYASRFENCQNFFDNIYGDHLKKGLHSKHFNLLADADRGLDWSLHHFPEEKVVFLGFNSCYSNDAHWRGAAINPRARTEIDDFLSKIPGVETYKKIAVWHHGLSSEQGHPDFLPITEVFKIKNLGFSMGFHGHTHTAERIKALDENFIIHATGSISASWYERAENIPNQFSIIKILPTRVSATVFEAREKNEYQVSTDLSVDHITRSHWPSAEEGISVGHDERVWTVGQNGIADVKINLHDVNMPNSSNLTLAVIPQPFCAVSGEPSLKVDGRSYKVISEPLPEEDCYYESQKKIEGKGTYKRCVWQYRLSNHIAISQVETGKLCLPTARTNIDAGEESISQIVFYRTDRLSLTISCETIAGGLIQVKPMAERPYLKYGTIFWGLDEDETARCKLTPVAEKDATIIGARLEVDAPIKDYRYSIVFSPNNVGVELDPEANMLLDLLRRNFGTKPEAHYVLPRGDHRTPFQKVLTNTLAAAIYKLLGSKPNGDTTDRVGSSFLFPPEELGHWIGFLWNDESNLLSPAFGALPPSAHKDEFRFGVGLAGYSFRFSDTAAWHRVHNRNNPSVIYKEKKGIDYQWILCVPILTGPRGPALGVICLFNRDENNIRPMNQVLSRLAQHIAEENTAISNPPTRHKNDHKKTQDQKLSQQKADLLTAINGAFWTAIMEHESSLELGQGISLFLEETAKRLGLLEEIKRDV